MRLTDDGINVMTGSAAPRAARPPLGPEPPGETVREQVAAMTVDEVLRAVEAGEIGVGEAVGAERAGRQRAGILALADRPES